MTIEQLAHLAELAEEAANYTENPVWARAKRADADNARRMAAVEAHQLEIERLQSLFGAGRPLSQPRMSSPAGASFTASVTVPWTRSRAPRTSSIWLMSSRNVFAVTVDAGRQPLQSRVVSLHSAKQSSGDIWAWPRRLRRRRALAGCWASNRLERAT